MTKKEIAKNKIKDILKSSSVEDVRALFAFSVNDDVDRILKKFNIWVKFFFPKFFYVKDAEFHKEMNKFVVQSYVKEFIFINCGFRGCAKTTKTKLILAFLIANDINNNRKYIKVLSNDINNATQFTTDIYNFFVNETFLLYYPEIFQKENNKTKREERMNSFTTNKGVKVVAGSVGVDQRGAIQEEARPDLIIFDDFETIKTLSSLIKTKTLRDNMEEARTGLSVNGSCIYLCNYISEAGNVHLLINKYSKSENAKVLITPILTDDNIPTWREQYPIEKIELMKKNDLDFNGERLCKPSANLSVFFDREKVDLQKPIKPIKTINGLKVYYNYDIRGLYGAGADVSGGVGLDSSTSVFINFNAVPAEVVAVFSDNSVKADNFAYILHSQSQLYGNCLIAPETNNTMGGVVLTILKSIKANLYRRETNKIENVINKTIHYEYGWETNGSNKWLMLTDLADAISKGQLILNDEDLINEVKYYSRNDILEKSDNIQLKTRHFDLLIALAIAWQTRKNRFIHNNNINNNTVKTFITNFNRNV